MKELKQVGTLFLILALLLAIPAHAAVLMNFDRRHAAAAPVPPVTVSDNFALINGGTFQMGSPANEPERSSDEIQHSVTVSSFYMAKTEVSQKEYQTIMGTNPSKTKGDNLPVTNITWYDAIQYCNRRSQAEGLTPCYTIDRTTVTWNKAANAVQKTGKALIVYFSQTGNTEGLANLIHEMSGADIFRLERATPYASSSNGPVLYGEALNELRSEAVPALKENPDISRYDILLGYCNWWSSVPACVRTFLTRNDLSGKTIVPFCSMGCGHFGQTISAIAKLAPNSVIKEGLEVTYSSYDRAEIQAWLDSLAQ